MSTRSAFRFRALVAAAVLLASALAFAEEEAPVAAEEEVPVVTERGDALAVLGCELSVDFEAVSRCLGRKIDGEKRKLKRQIDAAARDAKTLEQQWKAASAEANRWKRDFEKQGQRFQHDLARGIATATKDLESQLARARSDADRLAADLDRTRREAEARLDGELRKARSELERSPFFAALDWQRQLLQATRDLGLAPLFECLAVDSQRAQYDFARALAAASADPARFADRSMRDTMAHVHQSFGSLMSDDLARLAAGGGPAPSPRRVVEQAMDRLVAATEPMGGVRCGMRFVRPQMQGAVELAVGLAGHFERDARRAFDEHVMPALVGGIQKQLASVFASALGGVPAAGLPQIPGADTPGFLKGVGLSEREVKALARGVLHDRLTRRKLDEASAALDQVAAARSGPGGARDGVVRAIQATFEPTRDYEALYLEIGVEMLRAVGHKYIDSDAAGHGGDLVNRGIAVLNLSENLVEEIASALCGLVPEAGGAVCAAIGEGPVNALWSHAGEPLLHGIAQASLHGSLDALMDHLRDGLLAGRRLQQIRASAGPFGAVLAALPHEQAIGALAGAKLQGDLEQLDRHLTKVGALARLALEG